MFTGIVEEMGAIKSASSGRLVISAFQVLEGTRPGDSLNVNGACLTVTEVGDADFTVEVMPETLRRTNLGYARPGEPVNLERAALVGGRLGGHLVQGHVDGTATVLSLVPEAEAVLVRYAAPPPLMRYIVPRGFIAIDGVSLTVINCDASAFQVSLVGYTRQNTNLARRQPGGRVNLEVDIIAKYVERFTGGGEPGLSLDFLAEHGFLRR